MPTRYTGPAMDLANLRILGIRAVDVACACGRRASVDVSGLPGSIEVPSLRGRLSGARPEDVRPGQSQYLAVGIGRSHG
jgi:hypothetical protein